MVLWQLILREAFLPTLAEIQAETDKLLNCLLGHLEQVPPSPFFTEGLVFCEFQVYVGVSVPILSPILHEDPGGSSPEPHGFIIQILCYRDW